LATSPCGETTLDIEKGPFIVPKPLSTHYADNPQYVYVWLGQPFTAHGTQCKVQLKNPQTTKINFTNGSGDDSLVLEYVIAGFGNVHTNQPDMDTTGRVNSVPGDLEHRGVPIPSTNMPIIYDLAITNNYNYPGYAMVYTENGSPRNKTFSRTYGGLSTTNPVLEYYIFTVPGKTYKFAARIFYASDDNAEGYFCGATISGVTSVARCNTTSKICEPAPSNATGDNIYPSPNCDALCNMPPLYECRSNNTCGVSTTGIYTSNADCMAKSPCSVPDMPLYECGLNNTCQVSTAGIYSSSADCMAKSPCGTTTLNIKNLKFTVPKPLNADFYNAQYVYVWLGTPFTAYRTQGKVTLTNPKTTYINLQNGSGPDALVLEYVIVAVNNVQMGQPDPDTQGRVNSIPGVNLPNLAIKYDLADITNYPGYAYVYGPKGTKRNAPYKSTNYGGLATITPTPPVFNFNFVTVPGKTYLLAARIAYAANDNADAFFCGATVSV